MRPAEEGLLLLCCALGTDCLPLSPAEYKCLAQRVQNCNWAESEQHLSIEHLTALGYDVTEASRIVALLDRPEALRRYLAVAARNKITVLTRISEGFPQRLRRLARNCPTALFCKGDLRLLESHCISLVGSRMLLPRNRRFAEHIGRLAAKEGITLVSGGASGADSAAQEACLTAGGSVICIVPDALTRHTARERVLFCSEGGYELAFTAGRALHRNHVIHALGEKTFVAQAELRRGGTWAGTADNLRRGLSEVYVFQDGSTACSALLEMGALAVNETLPAITGLLAPQLSIFDGISR